MAGSYTCPTLQPMHLVKEHGLKRAGGKLPRDDSIAGIKGRPGGPSRLHRIPDVEKVVDKDK